ncbi:3-hydroxybutyryl-CoA dehydratase [Lophium mytilinum]|uniref:3-hydroxybutyryl-CoA dehydratase n=1 Tax=Lophium mytilinum TaxID=390894 RepID=A0A6A6QWK1_9PEZI|nr:3-hydroxybutyryl-CoA dehydratase [Lophium mytilinum]
MSKYIKDDWPVMPDGSPFDGKGLLSLVNGGKSPFDGVWDVKLLLREIEKNLDVKVIDIPFVFNGANNYGLHMKTAHGPDLVARLARGDVNMPEFDGLSIRVQIAEIKFEAAAYQLLSSEPSILVSRLLYYRIPTKHGGPVVKPPRNLAGRRLMVFERAEGGNDVWDDLDEQGKAFLLAQAAVIRASLFTFDPPLEFSSAWLLDRLLEPKPTSFSTPVAPTRESCIHLFESKIQATIKDLGDAIGWPSDNHTVGPKALAAKQSLLRLLPRIMPTGRDEACFYRLVLEHGDFGIHNMSITTDSNGTPRVTSLYDWETGCILPALLSDPLMAVTVDLIADADAKAAVTRTPDDADEEDCIEYTKWAECYFKVLFNEAPEYEHVIQAGKDARFVWSALRDWPGDDPEAYFGDLGTWAESRMRR